MNGLSGDGVNNLEKQGSSGELLCMVCKKLHEVGTPPEEGKKRGSDKGTSDVSC